MNYQTLNEKLTGRCFNKRKLANNTYAIRGELNTIAVRLHNTDIITFFPDGKVVLNSGGWKTSTTKSRINEFSGLNIYQSKGIWYVSKPGDWENSVLFKDGMSYFNGELKDFAENDNKENKLRKQVRDYAKLVVSKLPLPSPSGGDCWFCSMRTQENKPLGDSTGNKEHLISHLKEKYVVPSLVYNALEGAGCNPQGGGSAWFSVAFGDLKIGSPNQIGRFVKKYLYRQLGLVA
jgi:hypothetical protein